MKKSYLFVLGCSFAVAGTIHAADSLVAGWDFSWFASSGLNSDDLATFNGAWGANYSDLIVPPAMFSGDALAANHGTVYYDGTNGSTLNTVGIGFSALVAPASGDILLAQFQSNDGVVMSDGSSSIILADDQTYYNPLSLGVTADSQINSVVFMADVGAGKTGSDWEIQFAGKMAQNNSFGDIEWTVSTDGINFGSVLSTSNVSDTGAAYTVDFGSVLDGAQTAYIKGTFTNLDLVQGERTVIDNFGIHSTVIPEPSTYAMIFGALAFGFISLRRRKNV